jgi:hypothetical protein
MDDVGTRHFFLNQLVIANLFIVLGAISMYRTRTGPMPIKIHSGYLCPPL